MDNIAYYYNYAARFVLPFVSFIFLIVCAKLSLSFRKRPTLAVLIDTKKGKEYPIKDGENVIGSGKLCDIRLNRRKIAKNQAVITHLDEGFRLCSITQGVFVNGMANDEPIILENGDQIVLSGREYTFRQSATDSIYSTSKKKPKISTSTAAALLVVFQIFLGISAVLNYKVATALSSLACFLIIIVGELVYFKIKKFGPTLTPELIAFYLISIGTIVTAASGSGEMFKQLLCAVVGFAGFIILTAMLKNINLCTKLQVPIALLSIGLLAVNVLFGSEKYGSKNWLNIGGVSFQPSELVKAAFIFATAATLEKLITTKNLAWFLGYSAVILGSLAIMKDFGTASIYFVAMMIIMFMRLCDKKAFFGLGIAAVIGVGAIATMMPYITARFKVYRHVWDAVYVNSAGFQQSRTMIAIASGGLFGMGPGNGNLTDVAAADTDLVFGVIGEELGFIIALSVAVCFVLIALNAFLNTPHARSTFYAISACGASAIFLVQTSLNIFGSVDILPLTGVPLPFVSNGGSAMIAAWLLLGFIKAQIDSCHTMQNENDRVEDMGITDYYEEVYGE